MTSKPFVNLEKKIDNAVELSGICRNEWCRSLETVVDSLESALYAAKRTGVEASPDRLHELSDKIHKAYRNLGPDIHV